MNDLAFTRDVNAGRLRHNLGSLANFAQFFVYFLIPDEKKPGKLRKIPVGPQGAVWNHAKNDWQGVNPLSTENWLTFDQAVASCMYLEGTKGDPTHGYTLGFAFTENDPFFFFDLDFAIYDDLVRAQEFEKWTTYFGGCFVETSSSGKGYHIVGRYNGTRPDHISRPTGIPLELYTKDRGMAFGLNWASHGSADKEVTLQLRNLIDAHFRIQEAAPGACLVTGWRDTPVDGYNGYDDDAELIEKACSMKSIAARFTDDRVTFDDLWNINADNLKRAGLMTATNELDESAIDAKLAYRLCWLTGCNMARVERLMYMSRHCRPKWNELRPFEGQRVTYLRMTILKEARKVTEPFSKDFYRKDAAPAQVATASNPQVTIQTDNPTINPVTINADIVHSPEDELPEVPDFIMKEAMSMIMGATDEDEVIDGLAVYLGAGSTTPAKRDSVMAAAQIVVEQFRKITKTEMRNIVLEAFRRIVKSNPICQGIIAQINQSWSYNTTNSVYIKSDSESIKPYKREEAAFRDFKRYMSECGLPGYLICQAYPNLEELLHDVCRIPHIGAVANLPAPHFMEPVRVLHPRNMPGLRMKIEQAKLTYGHDQEAVYCLNQLEAAIRLFGGGVMNTFNHASVPDAIEPSAEWNETFDLWMTRVLEPLCNYRQEVVQVILWFMAHNIKYPGTKIRWAPLIIGPQRCGKSTICEMIGAAIGAANTKKVMPHNLERKFTGFAEGNALVILDELKVVGKQRYDIVNMLKPYITDSTVDVEKKGENGTDTINTTNYIATSNYDDAIPQEHGDKRWFAVRVPADNPEGVLTMLGCVDEEEKARLFNRVYSLISDSRNAGMFRHKMLHWTPKLPPHQTLPNCQSLPFETDEKYAMMKSSGTSFQKAVANIIDSGVCEFVTKDVIYVAALSQIFEVANSCGAGFPRFSVNHIRADLAQMGYRFDRRPTVNGKNAGNMYARNKPAWEHACNKLRDINGMVPRLLPHEVDVLL